MNVKRYQTWRDMIYSVCRHGYHNKHVWLCHNKIFIYPEQRKALLKSKGLEACSAFKYDKNKGNGGSRK